MNRIHDKIIDLHLGSVDIDQLIPFPRGHDSSDSLNVSVKLVK